MSILTLNDTLKNGFPFSQVGFEVFQIPPTDAQRRTESALSAAYRHIDTAAQVGATPVQTIMTWHLKRRRIVLPTSASIERLTENLRTDRTELTELTEADLTAIVALEAGLRTGEDIDTFDIPA